MIEHVRIILILTLQKTEYSEEMYLNNSMLSCWNLSHKKKKEKEWRRPQQRIANETYHRREDIRWKTQDMIVEESNGKCLKRKDVKGWTHNKISVGIGNMNHRAEKT